MTLSNHIIFRDVLEADHPTPATAPLPPHHPSLANLFHARPCQLADGEFSMTELEQPLSPPPTPLAHSHPKESRCGLSPLLLETSRVGQLKARPVREEARGIPCLSAMARNLAAAPSPAALAADLQRAEQDGRRWNPTDVS